MRLSVIVPVRDGEAYLNRTLPALVKTLPPDAELIVSDDGSRDGSAALARENGARVVAHPEASGPGAARNRGAREAQGGLLVFLDADVRVHPDTLALLLGALEDPSVAAAFGSYDATPESSSWISLYKNLAHHFVHQRSRAEASTFWAGCGAIRADIFRQVGGFDERYRRPSIEDVALGLRLLRAGHRIRLVHEAQATHLKRWTLAAWLLSDLRDRAIPWARLMRAGAPLPLDLNFTLRDRAASALVVVGFAAAALALGVARALWASAAAFAGALLLDADFIAFAARRVSPAFGVAAGLLHLVHRTTGLIGLAIGWLGARHPARLD
jgi:GT2 family glycosyltransferase